MSKKLKDKLPLLILTVFLIVIAADIIFLIYIFYATSHKNEAVAVTETKEELMSLLNSQDITIEKTDLQEITAITQPPEEPKEDAQESPAKPIEAVTDQAVSLQDVYSENKASVLFKCYDHDADAYEWEYYDLAARKWIPADTNDVHPCPDELGRDISTLNIGADIIKDGLTVRCTMNFKSKEPEIQTASLHLLDKIKSISIEDLETDANRYLGTNELPVTVTYESGSKESITGLDALYFIKTEENTDYGSAVSGNQIETTTITKTECQYLNTGFDKKEILVRYRPDNFGKIESLCSITGRDAKAPEISDVTISPFEISNIDEPVILTVAITAEDDATPYPDLEYAFAFCDQELSEADWGKKPSFDVCIERNGIYSAYVRDQSGNISTVEKEIVTVDTKAPVISSVSLSNADGWCTSNTITVKARDAGDISYCYENRSDGTSSGWITYNDYTVDSNGTWTIKAKDAVGNISETEIIISNIDNQAPVIKRINVK